MRHQTKVRNPSFVQQLEYLGWAVVRIARLKGKGGKSHDLGFDSYQLAICILEATFCQQPPCGYSTHYDLAS